MKTQINYRTFDELLSNVKIDLRGIDLEGLIEAQELIKVAIRINKELGLKIQQGREAIIEIMDSKARIPLDFQSANYADLCENEKVMTQQFNLVHASYLPDIATMADYYKSLKPSAKIMNEFVTTTTLQIGYTPITHDLNSTDIMAQFISETGDIMSCNFIPSSPTVILVRNDSTVGIENVKVMLIASADFDPKKDYNVHTQVISILAGESRVINHSLDTTDYTTKIISPSYGTDIDISVITISPFEVRFENNSADDYGDLLINIISNKDMSVEHSYDNDDRTVVAYTKGNVKHVYEDICPIEFINKKRHNTLIPTTLKTHPKGYFSDNYFHTNFTEGVVYLNYNAALESENGELLLLDHELVNEYYEYALKAQIFESMWLNGEPNVQQRLNFILGKLRIVRLAALSFINSIDFKNIKDVHDLNKRAQHHNYFNAFK